MTFLAQGWLCLPIYTIASIWCEYPSNFHAKWRLLCLLSFKSIFETCGFENWWIFSDISQFLLEIFCHMTCLDQSHASKNIRIILSSWTFNLCQFKCDLNLIAFKLNLCIQNIVKFEKWFIKFVWNSQSWRTFQFYYLVVNQTANLEVKLWILCWTSLGNCKVCCRWPLRHSV